MAQSSHLRYFGWYSDSEFTEETSDHANVIWTSGNPYVGSTQFADEAVIELKKAEAQGMTVVLGVDRIFFTPESGQQYQLRPAGEYSARWSIFSNAIRPYAHLITAFF